MKKKVLVFPAGSEIGLEINRSLRYSKDFEIIGASSVNDHGRFAFETHISGVSFVDEIDFIKDIKDIVQQNQVDYIFPAHDSVVLKLAQHRDEFDAELIAPELLTCEIARSKGKRTINSKILLIRHMFMALMTN
jgi:hypothetical protein